MLLFLTGNSVFDTNINASSDLAACDVDEANYY